jgi:AcrR family transcriptional regulator
LSDKANKAMAATTRDTTKGATRLRGPDRRYRIIQAALLLFSEKGFDATTTKEIAQAAGISEAVIFRHFQSKDELYAAILRATPDAPPLGEWLAELTVYAERRDDARLFGSFAARVLEYHSRDPVFLRLMLYSALEHHALARRFSERQIKPANEFLRQYIIRRQQEGVFRACDPDLTVRAFAGMLMYHLLVTKLFEMDACQVSDESVVENFTRLFLDGLRRGTP